MFIETLHCNGYHCLLALCLRSMNLVLTTEVNSKYRATFLLFQPQQLNERTGIERQNESAEMAKNESAIVSC